RFRIIDNCEQIATDPIHHGLNYAERSVGGNCRIHSVAASRQNGRTGLRCNGLAGRYNPILRHHHGAGLLATRRSQGGSQAGGNVDQQTDARQHFQFWNHFGGPSEKILAAHNEHDTTSVSALAYVCMQQFPEATFIIGILCRYAKHATIPTWYEW